jgi:hypothetical protein
MSDKKRNTFFNLIFCSHAKNSRFITRLFIALEKNTANFIKQIVICLLFFVKKLHLKLATLLLN